MPHYLGGKLGRSSSRSIFPSIHLPPQALPRAAAPAPLPPSSRSRSPRLDFAGRKKKEKKKRNNRAIRSAFLSLSLSFTHTTVSVRFLYIVYFRIGSLSTRDPPPSPLSYRTDRRLQPLSPTLFLRCPSSSRGDTPQHHPNSPFPQNRESV